MTVESNKIALENYFKSYQILFKEGILINKKDFTGQIGEWIVEAIYDGKRANSGIQKGWDVEVNAKKTQVKSHSKAGTNTNRWSAFDYEPDVKVDELIIIVFTPNFKIKHFFIVPWSFAYEKSKVRGEKKKRREINWSDLKKYDQDLNTLPKQEIISLFI